MYVIAFQMPNNKVGKQAALPRAQNQVRNSELGKKVVENIVEEVPEN